MDMCIQMKDLHSIMYGCMDAWIHCDRQEQYASYNNRRHDHFDKMPILRDEIVDNGVEFSSSVSPH